MNRTVFTMELGSGLHPARGRLGAFWMLLLLALVLVRVALRLRLFQLRSTGREPLVLVLLSQMVKPALFLRPTRLRETRLNTDDAWRLRLLFLFAHVLLSCDRGGSLFAAAHL